MKKLKTQTEVEKINPTADYVLILNEVNGQMYLDYPINAIASEFGNLATNDKKLEFINERKLYYRFISKQPEKYNLIVAIEEGFIKELELKQKLHSQFNNAEIVSNSNNSGIKWNDEKYSNTEFLELCKSLLESNAIIGVTQKSFIEAFSLFLNLEVKNVDQTLQSIKNSRNNDAQTKFLDTLKSNLLTWINKTK